MGVMGGMGRNSVCMGKRGRERERENFIFYTQHPWVMGGALSAPHLTITMRNLPPCHP